LAPLALPRNPADAAASRTVPLFERAAPARDLAAPVPAVEPAAPLALREPAVQRLAPSPAQSPDEFTAGDAEALPADAHPTFDKRGRWSKSLAALKKWAGV
jgi:hypothetical protein